MQATAAGIPGGSLAGWMKSASALHPFSDDGKERQLRLEN